MKLKIHWKLTLFFCLALLAGLLAGYFYLISSLNADAERNLGQTLQREIFLARDFLETHQADQGSLRDADTLADRIGQHLGLLVTVMSPDGEVIGDSELAGEQLAAAENHLNRTEVRDALQTGYGVSKRFSYTIKKYLLYVAVPLGGDEAAGVLRLAMPLTDVALFEARLQKIVLFSVLMIFLLSLVFTYAISLIISQPLRRMAETARGIAKGDFSVRPPLDGRDEVGELGRAIFQMSEEIKRQIEQIAREGARLDAVLSSMFEGVMVVNDRAEVLLMNPSMRKSLFVDRAPEGRPVSEIVRVTAVAELTERLVTGSDPHVSAEIRLSSDEDRYFRVNGVKIMRNDRCEGGVLVFHDITEIRRLENIRQEFVANVSHELRTPVASIKGYAETLLEGAIDDKAHARDFVGIIQQNSDRLVSLINDLLDLARIESGKMQLVFTPVDLKSVVSRCLGILEKGIAKKSLTVSVDLPDGLPRVKADESRLSQVLLNLLDNAVKYTPEGGSVKVSAVTEGPQMRISVADTGHGIAPEDQVRIFERFYRVDRARSRELGGTGLGLSIVKHIVQAHGGEVFVASELGEGSVFAFTIPVI